MDSDPASSYSSGSVVSFLRVPDRFLFDGLGGSGRKVTRRITDDCATSSSTTGYGGTNAVVYSIMGISEGVSTLYS